MPCVRAAFRLIEVWQGRHAAGGGLCARPQLHFHSSDAIGLRVGKVAGAPTACSPCALPGFLLLAIAWVQCRARTHPLMACFCQAAPCAMLVCCTLQRLRHHTVSLLSLLFRSVALQSVCGKAVCKHVPRQPSGSMHAGGLSRRTSTTTLVYISILQRMHILLV